MPAPVAGAYGYLPDRAVGDPGRDDARQRDAVAEELGREAVVGLPVHLLRGADLSEASVAHHRHLVGDRQRLLLVMGHQQRCDTRIGEQSGDDLPGGCPQAGVQRAERFVEQHQHRLAGEGTGERDTLLLAAGELMRAACCE